MAGEQRAMVPAPRPPAPAGRAALAEASPAAPWPEILAVYLETLDSAATRRAYGRHVELAMRGMGVADLRQLRGEDLVRWRRLVIEQSGWAGASIVQHLAGLRSFLKWARAVGAHQLPAEVWQAALPTWRAQTVRPYEVLEESEIRALLGVITNLQDRAFIALLVGSGVRVGEALNLEVGDLHPGPGGEPMVLIHGKGRKDRMVPLTAESHQLLRRFVAGRQTGRVFGFGEHTARRLLNRYLASAGVTKRLSPHSLRHTAAIRTLRHSGDIAAVQKILGHGSITVTQRYVDHLKLSELSRAIPELPL